MHRLVRVNESASFWVRDENGFACAVDDGPETIELGEGAVELCKLRGEPTESFLELITLGSNRWSGTPRLVPTRPSGRRVTGARARVLGRDSDPLLSCPTAFCWGERRNRTHVRSYIYQKERRLRYLESVTQRVTKPGVVHNDAAAPQLSCPATTCKSLQTNEFEPRPTKMGPAIAPGEFPLPCGELRAGTTFQT